MKMHEGECSWGSCCARVGSGQPCSGNKGSDEPPVPTSSSSPRPERELSEHCALPALGLQLDLLLSQVKADQKINDSVSFLCFGVPNKGNS